MTKRSALMWVPDDAVSGLKTAVDGSHLLTIGPRGGRHSWYVTRSRDVVAHGVAASEAQAKVDALDASRRARRGRP